MIGTQIDPVPKEVLTAQVVVRLQDSNTVENFLKTKTFKSDAVSSKVTVKYTSTVSTISVITSTKIEFDSTLPLETEISGMLFRELLSKYIPFNFWVPRKLWAYRWDSNGNLLKYIANDTDYNYTGAPIPSRNSFIPFDTQEHTTGVAKMAGVVGVKNNKSIYAESVPYYN